LLLLSRLLPPAQLLLLSRLLPPAQLLLLSRLLPPAQLLLLSRSSRGDSANHARAQSASWIAFTRPWHDQISIGIRGPE
jgi:hypothetical protein